MNQDYKIISVEIISMNPSKSGKSISLDAVELSNGEKLIFKDKDKIIDKLGCYEVIYYETEYEGKTYKWVNSAKIIPKNLDAGISKIKQEFQQNNKPDFVPAKDYKREEPSNQRMIVRQSCLKVASEIIKLRYQNNLVEKQDLTTETIEEAKVLEKWVME